MTLPPDDSPFPVPDPQTPSTPPSSPRPSGAPSPVSPRPPVPPPSAPSRAASTFDPNLFPSRHRPWRQWIGDHNPCLLLSMVCMLLGCYLVNSTLHDEPGNLRMFALLGLINLYEACIIPLGLLLVRRSRGTARDGWWLVLFETLFLVNATFVNPDFSQWWAIPLNAGLWILACFKAAILLRGLKIGLSLRTFGFLALQLGIIYALPAIFGLTNVDGYVSPKIMYGLWCVVGLLPLIYDLLARWQRPQPEWDLVQNVIRRVYLIAPWVMLVMHLGFSHWAHHSDFVLADVAPALLGLAIASTRVKLNASLRPLARALPAAALLVTFLSPAPELQWALPLVHHGLTMTPALLMIGATILTYGYMVSMFHFLFMALALFAIACGYLLRDAIIAAVQAAGSAIAWLLPTTTYAWGMLTILFAFVLLGIGTLLSLRRGRKPT